MSHRTLKLSHAEIEIVEAALQHHVNHIEQVDRKAIFSNDTRKVILKERKNIEDVLYAIKEGQRDV